MIAVIIQEWALSSLDVLAASPILADLSQSLQSSIEAPPPAEYIETASLLQGIQADCQALYSGMTSVFASIQKQMSLHQAVFAKEGFKIATAQAVIGSSYLKLVNTMTSAAKGKTKAEVADVLPRLEEKKSKISIGVAMFTDLKERWDIQLYASLAGTLVALNCIPAKLNPLIKSVMNSIKVSICQKVRAAC